MSAIGELAAKGANVRARNRRGAEPLHYAADGGPTLETWDPRAQAAVVEKLLSLGADPNALDDGVAPLIARFARCTAAVRALLDRGARPRLPNGSGSTPRDLALGNTGRGGTAPPKQSVSRPRS